MSEENKHPVQPVTGFVEQDDARSNTSDLHLGRVQILGKAPTALKSFVVYFILSTKLPD
jgi:hypothetical protein